MPAWMTSLLRELVPVPKVGAESRTRTCLPLRASSLATAIPTTPAPITTHSALSLGTVLAVEVAASFWVWVLLHKFLSAIHLLLDDDEDGVIMASKFLFLTRHSNRYFSIFLPFSPPRYDKIIFKGAAKSGVKMDVDEYYWSHIAKVPWAISKNQLNHARMDLNGLL